MRNADDDNYGMEDPEDYTYEDYDDDSETDDDDNPYNDDNSVSNINSDDANTLLINDFEETEDADDRSEWQGSDADDDQEEGQMEEEGTEEKTEADEKPMPLPVEAHKLEEKETIGEAKKATEEKEKMDESGFVMAASAGETQPAIAASGETSKRSSV